MSLPVALTAASASAVLSPVDAVLQIFNSNPYFIGIMMLILNLGGRFINLEVTKNQELFLQRPWVRRILIFVVLFVATRSLHVAFWTTVVVVLLLGYLFNENSAMCLFQGGAKGATCANTPSGNAGHVEEGMTSEEKEILQRLMAKSQRFNKPKKDDMPTESDDDVLHTEIYAANLSLLRSPF
uniref:Uncharacterized protein n=1 Tax=viral metagenome TaxID=1070528 RepID=A0A6C0IHT6_9ZZZZ